MCQVCEMHGDGKCHLELKVQWTAQNSNSVQVKQLQDITVSVVDWTKSENECTQIGKMKYCWNCGKKLED